MLLFFYNNERICIKISSILFLRCAVVGFGALLLIVSSLLGYSVFTEWPLQFPEAPDLRYLALLIILTTVISFLMALYQALKLLTYIEKNQVFTQKSVEVVSRVKLAAMTIAGALFLGMPIVYMIAEKDDAPGLILFGLVFVVAPLVVAVAAAVLGQLLKNVIAIKSENDLTV